MLASRPRGHLRCGPDSNTRLTTTTDALRCRKKGQSILRRKLVFADLIQANAMDSGWANETPGPALRTLHMILLPAASPRSWTVFAGTIKETMEDRSEAKRLGKLATGRTSCTSSRIVHHSGRCE